MPTVKVSNVSKSYGTGDARQEVLKNLSVTLEPGELVVLLGPSGSGKSTFLNLLGGLEQPDSGSIMVGERELAGASRGELSDYRRDNLGFVFQFYNLVPDLTVRENIEVTAHISKSPLDVDKLLGDLGLADQAKKFSRHISGGQQQRCAIGRALVKNPGLLLCDEPTGALDFSTSLEILSLIEKINREYGTTVVIVTHNNEIARMATRVLKLHDGHVASDVANDVRVAACDLEW